MRYMIDTRTIPKGRPSAKQVAMNEWKINEMILMGLTVPYDSAQSNSGGTMEIVLTQFNSNEEHCNAMMKAFELLDNFQPVPEPMRTKLILEAENFKKHGKHSCLL